MHSASVAVPERTSDKPFVRLDPEIIRKARHAKVASMIRHFDAVGLCEHP